MSQPRMRKAYSWIAVGSIVFGVILAVFLVRTIEYAHYEELHQVGEERLNLYASTVEAEHKRFDYLPFIIAQDHQVLQLLSTSENESLKYIVNQKLENWQQESNAEVLYLMDKRGVVVSSSNWSQSSSFVGSDYHFRPYFKDAFKGKVGRFFAVGVTTGQPGFFLSRPVINNEEIVGVAVLKINMSALESNWNAGGEQVWVSDGDGVIFLASNPSWRYRSLTALSDEVVKRLKDAKKYSHHPISPLNLTELEHSTAGDRIVQLISENEGNTSRTYLLHHREIADLDWSLYYLSDLSSLAERKKSALLISILVSALIAVVGWFLLSRYRHQQQLEVRVEKRTQELKQSNTQLKLEVDERIRTENVLRRTHDELIQAEKLGALGQISAELVHEISQPLQATLTFLASTKLLMERQEHKLAKENIGEMDKLIRRVTGIVSHLKTFASKSRGILSRVELQHVINNSLLVLNSRLDKSNIELIWLPPSSPVRVNADEIKLEQTLVNLIRNAIDAVGDTAQKKGTIEICLLVSGEHAEIKIKDNGCGIDPEHLPKVFEPFYSTKPQGKGMGLGLSVSYGIIEEFGGRLEVSSNSDKGTTFTVTLLLSPEPAHA